VSKETQAMASRTMAAMATSGADGRGIDSAQTSVRDEIQAIRERLVRTDTRLEGLEARALEIQEELGRVARLLRGNGERGVVAELRVQDERLRAVEKRWRWILWLVAMVVVVVIERWIRTGE